MKYDPDGPPCKVCTMRQATCHIDCSSYLAWREAYKENHKQDLGNRELYAFIKDSNYRRFKAAKNGHLSRRHKH